MRIEIVNEQDEILKSINPEDKKPGEITRIAGLWITNEKGEILLAQRSFEKKWGPGLWGPAVSGTVEEGETYESNIIKEAQEEIGLYNIKPKVEHKLRGSTSHDYFLQWFSLVIDSSTELIKQDSEVEKIKWFTKEELLDFFDKNPEMFVSRFERTINYFIKHENQS